MRLGFSFIRHLCVNRRCAPHKGASWNDPLVHVNPFYSVVVTTVLGMKSGVIISRSLHVGEGHKKDDVRRY